MRTLSKLLMVLILLAIPAVNAWATVLTIPLVDNHDDSEERYYDRQIDYLTSPDLDLGEKLVGVRFRYVQIPVGAIINSAYIEFVADDPLTQTSATPLTIRGENEDWSQVFTSERRDISGRHTTAAAVDWRIVSNWANGDVVQTPDVSAVVQEIIDREGWSMGNALTFIINGSGHRIVESHDGNSANAARLVVDFTPQPCRVDVRVNQSSDDVEDGDEARLYDSNLRLCDRWVGLRFQNLQIPAGATITKAYLDLATGNGDNEKSEAKVRIYGHDIDNSPTFTNNERFRNRHRTGSNVRWRDISRWRNYGEKHRSPDLREVIQEIVGRGGWNPGQALTLLLREDKGQRPLLSYDGDAAAAPLLHVEWDCGVIISPTQPTITLDVASSTDVYLGAFAYQGFDADSDVLTVSNTGSATLNFTVSGMTTWVNLSLPAGTTLTPTTVVSLAPGAPIDLTVTYTNASEPLGVYETTLTVSDANATNNPQEIPVSLTVAEAPMTNRSCNNVPLYVENRPSPAVLIELDLSGSMGTSMTVAPPGVPPRTPDLTSIVQEIVNYSGWQSDNAMAFFLTGSGSRRAYSYDGQSSDAPLLVVDYTYIDPNDGVTVLPGTVNSRVRNSRDDAEQRVSGGSFSTSSNELNLGYDRSNANAVGLRFQNVTIPQGATIRRAYIEFATSAADSSNSDLLVKGEATNNAREFRDRGGERVVDRSYTTASVAWNNLPNWAAPTKKSRIEIGQQVISDIVKNRNIAWGFGSWTSDFPSNIDYTKVNVGSRINDDTQQADLQTAIEAVREGGRTPFVPSMNAALKYFNGTKADETGDSFSDLSCQDKFLIEVTDGLGNVNSDVASATTAVNDLADSGISTVAVGFGIDNASQIQAVAQEANTRGDASTTDNLYALHEVDASGAGVPFLANNQQELLDALMSVSRKIENRFTGAAPAPTTSADDTDLLMVLIAEFGSASWTGDLRAITYDPTTRAWGSQVWLASEQIPASRNAWTIDTDSTSATFGQMVPYTDATLPNDNFLCKPIGDIIDSAPVIVKAPNYFYSFDNYLDYYVARKNRNRMVYIGANDGQLHAFMLTDKTDASGTVLVPGGTEMWSFVPPSMQAKLNLAGTDPTLDMCSPDYCHQYFVDGSPQAGDIYTGSAWKTIVVTGMREGGDSYFALDVTDGEPMQAGSNGAKFLWEFTDSELGQTWGDATIERAGDFSSGAVTPAENQPKTWAVYFGSGYDDNPINQATSKEAYVYGIDAWNKSSLWVDASNNPINRIKLSSSTLVDDATSGVLVMDKDRTINYAVDHLYVGNLYGDLYRVTDIGKSQTPSVSLLYESNNTNHAQPIRAKPEFAYAKEYDSFWVYFGTGRYELQIDKVSTDKQYFFGLKETPDADGNYTTTYTKPAGLGSAVIDPAATNRLPASGTPQLVVLDAKTQTASYTDPATGTTTTRTFKTVEGLNETNEPWVMRLDYPRTGNGLAASERSLNQPLVVGGVVFFTTFIPSNDPCSGSGHSYLYALDYKTGLPPKSPVFDLNGDGAFNEEDNLYVDESGNTAIGTGGDATGKIKVPIGGIDLGPGQASRPVMEQDVLFVSTTEPRTPTDDGSGTTGSTAGEDAGGIAEKANLPLLKVNIESWRDNKFQP